MVGSEMCKFCVFKYANGYNLDYDYRRYLEGNPFLFKNKFRIYIKISTALIKENISKSDL